MLWDPKTAICRTISAGISHIPYLISDRKCPGCLMLFETARESSYLFSFSNMESNWDRVSIW